MNLTKKRLNFLTECLKESKPLPDNYRYIIPFEKKKEYELTYDGKEREQDILADTMAVPLQPVKTFGNPERDQRSYGAGGNEGWTNKLIFGDNIQYGIFFENEEHPKQGTFNPDFFTKIG